MRICWLDGGCVGRMINLILLEYSLEFILYLK